MVTLVHITTVPQTLNFLRGQIGYLRARGFRVHAISSPGTVLSEVEARDGVTTHVVPMSRSISPARDVLALARLWLILRRLRPHLVHSHTPKAGLLGTLAARCAGVPVVFLSVFGLVQMNDTGLRRTLLDTMTWISCRLAHRVWFDSLSMQDYAVSRHLCPLSKTVVFGNGSVAGVDAEHKYNPTLRSRAEGDELKDALGIGAGEPVIGFVGRIVGDKGIHELATAWQMLQTTYPKLHLLMVGSFEDKDPVRAETLEMLRTMPRVHLVGQQSDVPRYMMVMDVFVMPSYREGFGVTNIEAAAMALPVVSTRIPGCVDSVQDGVTGTLVPPRDPAALAEAIATYLQDPELRRLHGQAGRQRVLRDFRPEDVWSATYEEYVRLLREKRLSMPPADEASAQ